MGLCGKAWVIGVMWIMAATALALALFGFGSLLRSLS
jgi:hypothetical protein